MCSEVSLASCRGLITLEHFACTCFHSPYKYSVSRASRGRRDSAGPKVVVEHDSAAFLRLVLKRRSSQTCWS